MKKKGIILIIDDEKDIKQTLKELLAPLAEKVFVAESGKEGIEIIEKNKINCVICDVKMPEMDGVKVLKNVREKGLNTPFIFFTAHGSRDLMMEIVKYGVFDFLNKPNFEGLEEMVMRCLQEDGRITKEPSAYISEFRQMLDQLAQKS